MPQKTSLCTQCQQLPANPGRTTCPLCYASSKPLCQQCNSRPTNPGYSLCQPCFASSDLNNNAAKKAKPKSVGADPKRRPPRRRQQRPQWEDSAIGWPQEHPWPAGPWQMASPYPPELAVPLQVYPSYMPHPMLQLQHPQNFLYPVPVQPRAPSPLSPAYNPRCTSPNSDGSCDLSPCLSVSSSQETSALASTGPWTRRASTTCGGCNRVEAVPGCEYCADCLETGGPDSDDLEMNELISSMFPTIDAPEPPIKMPVARSGAGNPVAVTRPSPPGASSVPAGMPPMGPAGRVMYPFLMPWM